MEKVANKNKKSVDSLGNRMKGYENVFRNYLPKRSYVIIRLDGKSFHSFTKGLNKPFDDDLIEDMNETTKYLCANIQGAKLGYVQSDEISLILTDFETFDTQSWFESNIQKMCSISASLATAKFNELRMRRNLKLMEDTRKPDEVYIDFSKIKLAQFDSRVFLVPNRSEAMNYLLWRENDCVRNSISMVAQSLYPHKELHGKNTDQMQEMIFQKSNNWNDLDAGKKRGRLFAKQCYVNGVNLNKIPNKEVPLNATVRNKWEIVETPLRFSANDFALLKSIIPNNE